MSYLYRIQQASLDSPRYQDQYFQLEDPQASFQSNQSLIRQDTFAKLGQVGIGVGAIGLIGNLKFKREKTGFDYIVQAIRTTEAYSPARILSTLQLSEMFSFLESSSKQTRFLSSATIASLRQSRTGKEWLAHLERLSGKQIDYSIASQGLRFQNGRIYIGTSNEIFLKHASRIATSAGSSPHFSAGYMRSLKGGPIGRIFRKGKSAVYAENNFVEELLRQKIAFQDAQGKTILESGLFIGGQTRTQAFGRYIAGYGTSLIERLNRLANTPFELPIVSDLLKKTKFGKRFNLSVVPSSGLKTLAKLTGKLGIATAIGYMGYKEIDYYTRKSKLFDNTILDEGITTGLGTVWARSEWALSKAAEYLDLHTYREKQEEIAPGSTSMTKLLAFPILGASSAAIIGYGIQVGKQIKYQRLGFQAIKTPLAVKAESDFFKQIIYGDKLPDYIKQSFSASEIDIIESAAKRSSQSYVGQTFARLAKVQQQEGSSFLKFFANKLGSLTPVKAAMLAKTLLGAAFIAPFVPGALIPEKTPQELEDLYSGKTNVPIRKGRFWSFGRSPYEGGRITYYRKHWYARMRARAKEKAIWGDQPPSPLKQWYIKNFTYDLERKFYQDRPYPVSTPAFSDVPIIGPILGATIGKLIKPVKYMHEEKWRTYDPVNVRGGVILPPESFGEERTTLENPEGKPILPTSFKGVAGEQIYRLSEAIGLPGYLATEIKKGITGTPDLFDKETQFEGFNITSPIRGYWDEELGDLGMSNEIFRRLYPHPRNQIQKYNPIPNAFANVDWLPGSGDKSPDFKRGDPFIAIPLGEERLPGPGYAAYYPELKGISPSDYPVIHRYAILSDIAPYSDKYRLAETEVRRAIARKQLSKEEIARYKEIKDQVKKKKVAKEFSAYKYKPKKLTTWEQALEKENKRINKDQKDDQSWFQKTVGSYWENIAHKAETPMELLTPVSPAAKLIHMRTAVEDYERTQLLSSSSGAWSHPIRDFIKPALLLSKTQLFKSIPNEVEEKRNLNEYFDILKYVKATRLKRAAQNVHDQKTVQQYEDERKSTLFGINPYTFNFSHIYRSLPRSERDYFNAFSKADLEEREEILKLIPENEKELYEARWKLADAQHAKKALKKNLLTNKEKEKAKALLHQIHEERETEGQPQNQKLYEEYLATRQKNETYPDWYRRVKLLEEKNVPVPKPSWVGWSPAISLEDIKLKIVENQGKNLYEYDMWPDQQRKVARMPILNEAVTELIETTKQDDVESRTTALRTVLAGHNIRDAHIRLVATTNKDNKITLNIKEKRDKNIEEQIKRGDI